jgi:hypothetical protein
MNNGTLLKTFDFPNLNHCNLFLEITIRRCLSLSPESQPLLKQLPFVAHHGPHTGVSGWASLCWPMRPRMLSELHQARWARAAAGNGSGGHDGRPWIHRPFATCTGRIGVGRSTVSIFPRIASTTGDLWLWARVVHLFFFLMIYTSTGRSQLRGSRYLLRSARKRCFSNSVFLYRLERDIWAPLEVLVQWSGSFSRNEITDGSL